MSDFTDRFATLKSFTDYVGKNFSLYPVTWVTGGMSGGNCWGDEANWPVEPEEEPELEVLDEILADVFPTLSFIQYRLLMRKPIVRVEDNSHSEWYGNYTTGKKKSLDVDALYEALSDL